MVWISVIAVLFLVAYGYFRAVKQRRVNYLNAYQFHLAIKSKLVEKYPQLNPDQVELVFTALRDYFYICNKAGNKMVSMPSLVADDAWHEFILFTRAYQGFCDKALGRFLHHTPAAAMKTPILAQQGIKRAWRIACEREGISVRHPRKMPLIFAIDDQLAIPGGFKYSLECENKHSPLYGTGYCASHIGCAAGCTGSYGGVEVEASDGGFFSDGGDSSGCGSGGCGGD